MFENYVSCTFLHGAGPPKPEPAKQPAKKQHQSQREAAGDAIEAEILKLRIKAALDAIADMRKDEAEEIITRDPVDHHCVVEDKLNLIENTLNGTRDNFIRTPE